MSWAPESADLGAHLIDSGTTINDFGAQLIDLGAPKNDLGTQIYDLGHADTKLASHSLLAERK